MLAGNSDVTGVLGAMPALHQVHEAILGGPERKRGQAVELALDGPVSVNRQKAPVVG